MPKYEGLVYRNIAVDAMCDIAIEERDRYKQAVEERKNDACKLVDEVVEQLNSLKGQIKADNYQYFLPKEELENKHREMMNILCHLEYLHNMHQELRRMTDYCSILLMVSENGEKQDNQKADWLRKDLLCRKRLGALLIIGCCLYKGKIYDVLGIEDGMYQIIDESGDCYLYGPGNFEIIEESAVYDTVKMKHRKKRNNDVE